MKIIKKTSIRIFIMVCILIVLNACGPSLTNSDKIATKVIQTQVARATGTASINQAVSNALTKAAPTETPTVTPSSTNTPVPTQTQTATQTPTAISTPLPECEGITSIPPHECAVLIHIYKELGGINWKNSRNWLESNDPCGSNKWFGITCSNKHIIIIDLKNNNLSGVLPPEIGQLLHLIKLNLVGNYYLSGPIPSELGNLINLKILWLSSWETGSLLNGPIPPELGNLVSLENLDIGSSQLTGTIPRELGNLKNLRQLWINDNYLTGQIPVELGNLAKLEILFLNNNNLSGILPEEFNNLQKMQHLQVSYNYGLSGAIPQNFVNLNNMYGLEFNDTQICEPNNKIFQDWLNEFEKQEPDKWVTRTRLLCPEIIVTPTATIIP